MCELDHDREPLALYVWVPILNYIDKQFDRLLGTSRPITCGIQALHIVERQMKSKLDDENKSDVDAELELKKMEEDRMTKIKAVDELSTKEIEQNLVASKSLLRMTALILKMSYNKDIYSSTEHLLMFLQAYDNELVGLAMNALAQLALPPPQHRYHEEFNRHNTPLHKVAMHSLAHLTS